MVALRPVLLLMVAALLCAGCGAEEEPASPAATATAPAATRTPAAPSTAPAAATPEEREVAEVIARYEAAVRDADAQTICDELLAAAVLERVRQAGGDCARDLLAERIAEAGPGYEIRVESIRVTGDRALARTEETESDGTRRSEQPLVRENGEWRLGVS